MEHVNFKDCSITCSLTQIRNVLHVGGGREQWTREPKVTTGGIEMCSTTGGITQIRNVLITLLICVIPPIVEHMNHTSYLCNTTCSGTREPHF